MLNNMLSEQVIELVIVVGNGYVLYSSFPVIHKVGNVDIFALPKFEKYER